MTDVFIRAAHLGLDMPVLTQAQRRSRGALSLLVQAALSRPKRGVRKILSDIDFGLESGDRLGVIGGNGAGKSTLLKVLVGAYQPTTGNLEVRGTRQALLNLSLGFNQEATVSENILLRGVAMGLKLSDANRIAGDVLEFAEIEHKAGDRLTTLSSGQRMRLGFAIATAVQHDILLMDEWISTGDAAFVEKAQSRLQSKVERAKIVVVATHSADLLMRLCNKALLLRGGESQYYGEPEEALAIYRRTR